MIVGMPVDKNARTIRRTVNIPVIRDEGSKDSRERTSFVMSFAMGRVNRFYPGTRRFARVELNASVTKYI